MKSEEVESYLANIEEFLFDDKKIVTYRWLSTTLGIHINLSKQLLHTFFEKCKRQDELCVTYLVIGASNGKDSCLVSVVKDKDLDRLESELQQITSKHVYSIQKCEELPDLNVLYAADTQDPLNTISKGMSAIDFNCNERSGDLLAKLKSSALPTASKLPTGPVKKANIVQSTSKNQSPLENGKGTNETKPSEVAKDSAANTETKNANFHPMFKNTVVSKKKPVEKASTNGKKQGGIGAFFSKSSKPSAVPTKAVNVEKPVEEKVVESNIKDRLSPLKENKSKLNICNDKRSATSSVAQEPPSTKTTKIDAKPPKTSKKVTSKKGKQGATKKPAKEEKKRKRLVVLSDSDSSCEEEEEVEREPTPEPEPAVVPDDDDEDMVYGTPEPSSRKRKKKLVSKSFTSPDGFLVTEKVYESCSENEEEVPEKKFKESDTQEETNKFKRDNKSEKTTTKTLPEEKKKSPHTKTSSPQKTKQASLMNFFKKK